MMAKTRAKVATIDGLQQALVDNALAGELEGFSAEDQAEAARFITEVAADRQPGEAVIRVESTGGEAGRRGHARASDGRAVRSRRGLSPVRLAPGRPVRVVRPPGLPGSGTDVGPAPLGSA